jgi:16S rRNA (uracil1498-N3)-methyltransferase
LHRFYLNRERIDGRRVDLPEEASRQAATVLRLRPGEQIAVFDGSGAEWLVRLDRVASAGTSGEIVDVRHPVVEPSIALTLCVAVLKADRFEFVLQRCTEAGVVRFQPFVSERCVAEMPRGQKLGRWERLVREAAEQSGRVAVPALLPAVGLADLPRLAGTLPGIVLWEEEQSVSLREALGGLTISPGARSPTSGGPAIGTSSRSAFSLVIGPEGGLARPEVGRLAAAGMVVASLGPRVLRAETAALAATTAAMYHFGQLGR